MYRCIITVDNDGVDAEFSEAWGRQAPHAASGSRAGRAETIEYSVLRSWPHLNVLVLYVPVRTRLVGCYIQDITAPTSASRDRGTGGPGTRRVN